MKDLRVRLEKLIADADDCDHISNLAADVHKRASRMAVQFRVMAEELKPTSRSERPQVSKPPMTEQNMTFAAYARRHGVSHQAVSRWAALV